MIQPKRLLNDVELDDIECWLRHAVADSLRNRRLVQLAAALQQLRGNNADLRRRNERLREHLRVLASMRRPPG